MAASTTSDDDEYVKGILQIAKEKALYPLHAATSKPARRAYIQTALLLAGACVLFSLAVTAYSVFYYAYIPTRGFSVPVHLQFDHHHAGAAADGPQSYRHPWGAATGLRRWLVSDQAYDVRAELALPRSRANRDAGNFMVELALLGPAAARGGTRVGDGISAFAAAPAGDEGEEVLAVSRRPACLTWYSDVVEGVNKAMEMPWYIMYNWRITSALVFTTAFWAVEMTFMILAWVALSNIFAPASPRTKQEGKPEDETDVKTEGETETDLPDLSDTPRTFPTYAGQPSLRYESPRVKSEEEDEAAGGVSADVPPVGGQGQEADDEDEDADFVLDTAGRHMDRDSGLGTSMESGQERREAVRKRRSGLFSSGSRNQ
ncbi:putative tubulin-tyrosine ligase protein [Neofusicoccum parvum]|uniref:Tubulin-tyrosine ligase protein n=1 Tax=Neofusicoccum parvum TaxID=310453 RepID=A0ACB5SHB1_9PEZI|nr:putative tubulin-tyrosine ligase protein [Neofusicoccum parvum]